MVLPSVSSGTLFGPYSTLEGFFNCVQGAMKLKVFSVTADTSAPVSILNRVALPLTSTWQVQ